VLFAADIAGSIDQGSVARAFESVVGEFDLPPRARERARELAFGVAANLKAVDERLERACVRWRLSRLATVDRNVLRVGAYELLFEPGTPREVVIDEAVEIARRFASEASPAFVNGVLDEVARTRADGVA
jgi:N utilization substance protein B